MTITVTATYQGPYYPNGITTTFPFEDFQVVDEGEVSATLDDVDIDPSDFKVTLNDDGTGQVVFFVAPEGDGATNELFLFQNPDFRQQTTLSNQGPYFQSTIEKVLDRLAVRAIWLRDRIIRAPTLPVPADDYVGKFPVVLPGGIFGWSSGTGADAGLRGDMADPDIGAALMMFRPSGVGAVVRSVLYALNSLFWSVERYGAVGDGVTDDTAAIQRMIDDVGYFILRAKTYRITDTLLIPAGGPYGTLWEGAGMEKSSLFCDGMAGKSAIKIADPNSLYRLTMRDFRIYGDCDTAIDFSGMSGGNQLYESLFLNLRLTSDTDSAFKASNHFSTSWGNVQCWSNGGHSFELEGDVATYLWSCYAHKAGPGKAGYRIKGIATLVECNGLDEGDIWGDFGAVTAQDGSNVQYRINLIGGNAEDFNVKAIRLRYTGSIKFAKFGFIPKATGNFVTLVDGSEYGAAGWKLFDEGSFYASKGATMSGASRILHNSQPGDLVSTGVFPDMRRTDQSVTYTIPSEAVANAAFAIYARQFGYITYLRSYGFNLQVPALWTVNALDFAVTRLNTVRTANTSATGIRVASGGEKGQRLTIIVEDANTTIVHNYASNGRFITQSGANIAAENGGVYEFVHNGTNWRQV